MNILDYINSLIEQGYTNEDAEKCANAMFGEDAHDEDEDYPFEWGVPCDFSEMDLI